MQARIAATGLIAGAVQGDDTQDSQPPHVDLMPCTFHSPSPRRASDWGMMEFCKRYGHSQDHGMARQTSGQQIPPKGTTRQKISKTSPSKREIHGFLTDRITRFPCQNMKLCKLGTGRRVSRRQGTKHPQKGRPDRSCPPTFACERPPGAKTRAADSLSHAKVSPGGSTSPFLEIGLDQIRDVGIEWNLQFIAQDRHALMDRFWQSQRDCLALRVDPGPSPGRHSPIPPERMGFFLCWRRVRLHAAIEQS